MAGRNLIVSLAVVCLWMLLPVSGMAQTNSAPGAAAGTSEATKLLQLQ